MRLRRVVTGIAVLAISVVSCAEQVGTRLPDCELTVRNPNVATLLSLQAVPTARYTPCIKALPLGWDNVGFHAEAGEGRLEIGRLGRVFLRVTITETCDISGAVETAGPQEDIRRYESVDSRSVEIGVTIVPSAARPLLWARSLVDDLTGEEVDGRVLVFTLDDRMEEPVSSRVNLALETADYVWIVDELGAEEDTIEVRGAGLDRPFDRVTVDDALRLIDDTVEDVYFEGHWFFVFEGGCITYTFDAGDRVAGTISEDTGASIGFYPAAELRQIGEEAGYQLIP